MRARCQIRNRYVCTTALKLRFLREELHFKRDLRRSRHWAGLVLTFCAFLSCV